jgi:RNA polymerase sigma factor (sigma-70 family)
MNPRRTFDARELTNLAGDRAVSCSAFVEVAAPKLRRAFAARFGVEVADDIAAEAVAYAWNNWERVSEMENPIGFLFSVGCSKARRYLRWKIRVAFPVEAVRPVESRRDLFDGLRKLSDDQRVAVLAVHGYGWTYAEVAEMLGVSPAAVTNHVHRGLAKLKEFLREVP